MSGSQDSGHLSVTARASASPCGQAIRLAREVGVPCGCCLFIVRPLHRLAHFGHLSQLDPWVVWRHRCVMRSAGCSVGVATPFELCAAAPGREVFPSSGYAQACQGGHALGTADRSSNDGLSIRPPGAVPFGARYVALEGESGLPGTLRFMSRSFRTARTSQCGDRDACESQPYSRPLRPRYLGGRHASGLSR